MTKQNSIGRRVAKVDGLWRRYIEALQAGDAAKAAWLKARWTRAS